MKALSHNRNLITKMHLAEADWMLWHSMHLLLLLHVTLHSFNNHQLNKNTANFRKLNFWKYAISTISTSNEKDWKRQEIQDETLAVC